MTRYYSYIDNTVGIGSETISGINSNGSEYGVVTDIDIVARNITATGNFIGELSVSDNQFAGIVVSGVATMTDIIASGVVTATSFVGDGANLTGTGSTLGTGSGVERVVMTSLTTGTMTSSSTDPNLVYDFDNNRFGVGTASPGLPLDIVSDASSETVRFRGASGGTSTLRFASNDATTNYAFIQSRPTFFDVGTATSIPLLFSTDNTERLRLDSSGRLALGTSSPEGKLTINGSAAEPPSSGTTANSLLQITSPLSNQINFGLHTVTGNYGGYIQVSDNNHAVNYDLNLQPKGGKVGIGTDSATFKLTIEDSTTPRIRIGDGIRHVNLDGGSATQNAAVGTDYAGSFSIYTNGDANIRLHIDSAGRFGIGTVSPGYKLDVNGEVAFSPNTAGKNTFLFTTNASDDASLFLKSDTTNKVNIQANGTSYFNGGNFGIGTASPGSKLEVHRGTIALNATESGDTTKLSWKYQGTEYQYIQRDNANGGLAFGDNTGERMRLDSSGRFGLGTSAVSGLFHAAGSSPDIIIQDTQSYTVSDGPLIQLQGRGPNAINYNFGYIRGVSSGSNNAGILQFATNRAGTQSVAMTIDSSQRVGIGTTSPTKDLEVAAGGTTSGGLLVTGSSSPQIRLEEATGVAGSLSADSNAVYVGSVSNHPLVLYANADERARIDQDGRLLVGTSSYTYAATLVLQGNSSASNEDAVIRIARGATPGANSDLGLITFEDNSGNAGASIRATNDTASSWGSGDYPGRLVFSTTADGASSPTERMRISSNGGMSAYTFSTDGHGFRSSQGSSTSHILIGGLRDATSTQNGTFVFVVRTNGQVENSTGSYGVLSDVKLKENIVDANSQWQDIKSLRIVNYNFKEETGYDTHNQLGVIAQEVELISPGLISESIDKDEEGNNLGTTTKSVKSSILYMKAVKALQEAMERIETLEQRLNDAGL